MASRRQGPSNIQVTRASPHGLVSGARFGPAPAHQGELKGWQRWLTPGMLLLSRVYLIKGWGTDDGRMQTELSYKGLSQNILVPGDFAVYIGELKRKTVTPVGAKVATRVAVHTFFFAGGEWVANPDWFFPAFAEEAEDY